MLVSQLLYCKNKTITLFFYIADIKNLNILSGKQTKENVWNVNTEKEYHEEKTEGENK